MVLVVMGVIHMLQNTRTHTSDGLMKFGMLITVFCYLLCWFYVLVSFHPSQQEPSSPAFREGLMVRPKLPSPPTSSNKHTAPPRRPWRSPIHRGSPNLRHHNLPRRSKRRARFQIRYLETPQIPHERYPRINRHFHLLFCGHQDETYQQVDQGEQIYGCGGHGF